ncbi:mitochondrial ribonuclease P protein 1 [Sarcoptes scabiei]|nr:mitochondrial ribonuclease P protein 1 [Sarcoptes scabiei]
MTEMNKFRSNPYNDDTAQAYNLKNSRSRTRQNRFIANDRHNRKITIAFILTFSVIIIASLFTAYIYFAGEADHQKNILLNSKMPCDDFHSAQSSFLTSRNDIANLDDHLSIYLLTWNVAGKEPYGSLIDLFAFNQRLYDVYVVALEELPLKSLMWLDNWSNELEALFANYEYVLLKSYSVMITKLFIFVKKRDLMQFSNIRMSSVKLVNNFSFKGGVAIRFVYKKVKIAFLGCHLTPHDENYGQRVKDYRYLMSEVNFGQETEKLNTQDITFILGDLNFRLNSIIGANEAEEYDYIVRYVKTHLTQPDQTKRFESLLNFDQIYYAMRNNEAFQQFEEPPINFAPTFKFVIGTCDYDDKRRPAWTDRILMRNLLKLQLGSKNDHSGLISKIEPKLIHYNSIPEYLNSDHKPVRQIAFIPILEMNKIKQQLFRQRRRIKKSIDSSEDTMNANDRIDVWSNIDDPDLFQKRYRIEFYHIPNWNVTKQFYAHFRLKLEDNASDQSETTDNEAENFLSEWDWVGLFPENFTSLDKFLTYSYPKLGSNMQAEEAVDALSMLSVGSDSNPSTIERSSQGDNTRNVTSTSNTENILTVYFDENCPIIAGRYLLIYVRANGDVIGVSDPFTIAQDIDLSSAI